MKFTNTWKAPGGSTVVTSVLNFSDGSKRSVAGIYLMAANASAFNPPWHRVTDSASDLDADLAAGHVLYYVAAFSGTLNGQVLPTGWWVREPTPSSPANVQREAADFSWGMQQLANQVQGAAPALGVSPPPGAQMVPPAQVQPPVVVVVPLYRRPVFLGVAAVLLVGAVVLLMD